MGNREGHRQTNDKKDESVVDGDDNKVEIEADPHHWREKEEVHEDQGGHDDHGKHPKSQLGACQKHITRATSCCCFCCC